MKNVILTFALLFVVVTSHAIDSLDIRTGLETASKEQFRISLLNDSTMADMFAPEHIEETQLKAAGAQHSFFLGVGGATITGDFKKTRDGIDGPLAYNFVFEYKFAVSPVFSTGLMVDYAHFSFAEGLYEEIAEFNHLAISLGGRFSTHILMNMKKSRFYPYIEARVGVLIGWVDTIRLAYGVPPLTLDQKTDAWGFLSLGTGVRVRITEFVSLEVGFMWRISFPADNADFNNPTAQDPYAKHPNHNMDWQVHAVIGINVTIKNGFRKALWNRGHIKKKF